MLTILTGPVGSGKTAELMARLSAHVKAQGRAIYIVPEQASFMAERDVYTQLKSLSGSVRVTSFTRLSEQIMKETGSGELMPLSGPGRYLLMAMALDEVSDLLSLYRRHRYSAAFVDKMVQSLDELRSAGITAGALSEMGRKSDAGGMGRKLTELGMVMEAYQALVDQHYADGTDLIEMAAGRVTDSAIVKGAHVYIDAFAGFTAPEYHMIEALLRAGCSVLITLGLVPGDSRYALAEDTARRLWAISERLGLGRPEQIHLAEALRYQSDEVALVAEEALTPITGQWLPPAQDVILYRAQNPYDELLFAAAEIGRLVRDEGYRYRDITLITRDATRYVGHLRPVFERHGIPLFVDIEEPADTKLLPSFLMAALRCALGREGMAPFLEMLKSPAMGLGAEEIGEFENYCYVWSVRPSELSEPFERPIDGFADAATERQRERLKKAESCRAMLYGHVDKLRRGLKVGRAADCARAVFGLLTDIDFGKRMAEFATGLPADERRDFLDEQALLWDDVVGILDLFGGVMGDMVLEPARFVELFSLCLSALRMALPPRTLDAVTFGRADRIRPDNPRAVLLLGAVEGEFPRAQAAERLLGSAERAYMAAEGYDLIRNDDDLYALEEYNCCAALGAASHRLVVSYPAATATGDALEPSLLYLSVEGLFAQPHRAVFSAEQGVCGLPSAFMALGQAPAEAMSGLRAFIQARGGGERLSLLERQAARPPRRLTLAGRELFAGRLRLSPTQLERSYSCPFQYFMRDGLGLYPRRRAELSPLESGTLIHEIAGNMVARHGGRGLCALSAETIQQEVTDIARQFILERVGEQPLSDARFSYLLGRLSEAGAALVAQLAEEFCQSLFEPVAVEMPVGEGGAQPLQVQLPDGRVISVEGRVDRVDMAMVGDKKFLRVVDYKSGAKRFSLSEVYHGLNMQMLVYLFALSRQSEGLLAGALPAGVLYMPTTQNYLRAERGISPDTAAVKRRAAYRMNGLLLDDPDALSAMEPEGGGIFIPRPGSRSSTEQLATLAEMGRLASLVERRVADMADYLAQGRIEAMPAVGSGRTPCDWCDYKGACGFETGDKVRYLHKVSRELVLGGESHG
jgi:ATP-dependent helicase/nuclease subunit B